MSGRTVENKVSKFVDRGRSEQICMTKKIPKAPTGNHGHEITETLNTKEETLQLQFSILI